MVSTRHHPRPFPEPTTPTSPTTTTLQNNTTTKSTSKSKSSSTSPTPPTTTTSKRKSITTSDAILEPIQKATSAITRSKSRSKPSSSLSLKSYTHILDPILLLWLFVSLPLVFWDTSYIALRPHTMPGGKYHRPIWQLYALYGTVDYMYGWPAWDGGVGFTAAQGALNALESAMYIYYLVIVYLGAKGQGVGLGEVVVDGFRSVIGGNDGKTIERHVARDGRMAGAVVVCFASAVMTLSKTILYWLNEYFSNFTNVGHNDWSTLFWIWILPNGLWLVLPTYMIYVLGKEITDAMLTAGKAKDS